MRKALASLAGLLGLAALVRALRGRPGAAVAPAAAEDPADALRRRLAASRAEEATPAEAPAEAPADERRAASLEERRARVHAKAQEALELMREPGEGT